MTKEELVSMGLSEEQAGKVLDAHKEELKEYVPKSRFNEVNEEKKTLKSQLADRDKQLTELKNTAGDNEQLKQKIAELEDTNKESVQTGSNDGKRQYAWPIQEILLSSPEYG